MGIRVTRICDLCKGEFDQIIEQPSSEEYTCSIDFICSDCVLEEAIMLGQEEMGTSTEDCQHSMGDNGVCQKCGIDISQT